MAAVSIVSDTNSNSKSTMLGGTSSSRSVTDTSAVSGSNSNWSSAPSSSNGSNGKGGQNNHHRYRDPVVGAQEGRRVGWAKVLVVLVLLVAAGVVSGLVYWFVSSGEQEEFEQQFYNYASEIIAVSSQHVLTTFATIESFAVSITSIAKATNQTWPCVTLPDFAARASRVATNEGSIHFVWGPVVQEDDRQLWETYALDNRQWWFEESLNQMGYNDEDGTIEDILNITEDAIYKANEYWENIPEDGPGPYIPIWQDHQFNPDEVWTNYNLLSFDSIKIGYDTMAVTMSPTLSFTVLQEELESQMLQPIFEEIDDTESPKLVGIMWIPLSWDEFFQNLLPENADGIVVVLRSSCGEAITYEINGLEADLLGEGDVHDTAYDYMKVTAEYQLFNITEEETKNLPADTCVPRIFIDLYPSDTMKEDYSTNNALWYTLAVVGIFVFTSAVFFFYDWMVKERQDVVMKRVIVTDKIVSDMFPTTFRDRLYNMDGINGDGSSRGGSLDFGSKGPGGSALTHKFSVGFMDTKLTKYIDQGDLDNLEIYEKKPIADLFLDTTVMVADICGFTAWSSQREPPQVFMLLEAIYGSFDKIAHRLGVFKVETVGDCYLAVAGLPEPNPNHAMVMAKFARACMEKMKDMTSKLEVALGPDTGDLEMRIGLNSGQVTAGVLRGDRTRFQLFGDTVNTASRMEATSHKSRIQVSIMTADLLIHRHERKNLLIERATSVFVKGKGEMKTYWLRTRAEERFQRKKRVDKANGIEVDDFEDDEDYYYSTLVNSTKSSMTKEQRLIEWNIDTLSLLLRQILASRGVKGSSNGLVAMKLDKRFTPGDTVLEEFDPIVNLPTIGPKELAKRVDPASVELAPDVVQQLREYVTLIHAGYRGNAFHNFEHASHVASSVKKMLSRIVAFHDQTDEYPDLYSENNIKLVDLAGHSFGITSDPLTQFSVVFSALIHDLDHQGVTNAQLSNEGQDIAVLYQKSIAEQNSVKLAWDLLMNPKFSNLRSCIYSTEEELKRFRQLVVNAVMATDIADKELQAARKERWEIAFADQQQQANGGPRNSNDAFDEMDPEQPVQSETKLALGQSVSSFTDPIETNRKATIVIEHLIQASDVSHTMQHWQVFRRWNESLFVEMLTAFREGRADKNPKEFWYKGEIGFFDFYIIPLAKKLKSCGVFGVSSHEYLSYAKANREEWALSGEEEVRRMVEKYNA